SAFLQCGVRRADARSAHCLVARVLRRPRRAEAVPCRTDVAARRRAPRRRRDLRCRRLPQVSEPDEPRKMSEPARQTEALINRYYAAFNSGDHAGMLDCLADDVVHDVNQGERRQGKERFRAFLARMAHHYREQLDGIAVMVTPDGTRAAAEFNVAGAYLVSEPGLPDAKGQRYALPAGAFFAIRD